MKQMFGLFVLFASLLLASVHGDRIADSSIFQFRTPNPINPIIFQYRDIDLQCSKPGILCSKCDSLVNCIQIGVVNNTATYVAIPVQKCDTANGEYCLIDRCSTDPNPSCSPPVPFTCSSTGIFPDPYNCRRYHICVMKTDMVSAKDEDKSVQYEIECVKDYGYDPVSGTCKVQLRNNICPATPPVPPCRTAGQVGPLSNSNIYYICVKGTDGYIRPVLYACPNGGRFANGRCY